MFFCLCFLDIYQYVIAKQKVLDSLPSPGPNDIKVARLFQMFAWIFSWKKTIVLRVTLQVWQ